MEIRCLIVSALLLLGAGLARAEQSCYGGNAASGSLQFEGAVEGSSFTGRFGEFSVRYCMPAGQPTQGSIEVDVALASADSNNRDRDQTLKGEEFFFVERYPQARWISRVITRRDAGGYRADGNLTLKGITGLQPIEFTLTPDGDAMVAQGRFTLAGGAQVERLRYEVGTGEFADPEFVRNEVAVSFEVRLKGE